MAQDNVQRVQNALNARSEALDAKEEVLISSGVPSEDARCDSCQSRVLSACTGMPNSPMHRRWKALISDKDALASDKKGLASDKEAFSILLRSQQETRPRGR